MLFGSHITESGYVAMNSTKNEGDSTPGAASKNNDIDLAKDSEGLKHFGLAIALSFLTRNN